ncbi:PREDICTED: circulating cathodic antigen homolog [Bactrocera latifrons]|uniref:Circulating cathodic antigen n=1 Tax=Bactrocera latifrons TaxID=174628 RepID=A0A0K8UBJ3_BACLA|nr:PREDICTED: circulating cathodic antigen homolog [Bactrocera latifrons]
MSNMSVGQIIMDAQRIASRVKDLEMLGNALFVEAEGNNRLVESLRQFQDDMDSLNQISNNKSNSEMVNRIQQQNATSSEILKENRELKICIEDYERTLEFIMQKYREHTSSKILESKINFKEVYNEELWLIIREQRAKIREMAVVMQRAASADDDAVHRDMETMSRLRKENQILRELLQISKQFGSASQPIRINEHMLEEKGVQTDGADDSADELSLSGASIENFNNNSVISLLPNAVAVANAIVNATSSSSNANTADNINVNKGTTTHTHGENNNGPLPGDESVTISFMPPINHPDTVHTTTNANTGNTSVIESAATVSSTGCPTPATGNTASATGTTNTTGPVEAPKATT